MSITMLSSTAIKRDVSYNCKIKLTKPIALEAILDLFTELTLLADLSSQELSSINAFPSEVLGDVGGIFLSEAAWWSHYKDSSNY